MESIAHQYDTDRVDRVRALEEHARDIDGRVMTMAEDLASVKSTTDSVNATMISIRSEQHIS